MSSGRPPRGFTLLSVMVAMIILAFGLLGLVRAYMAVTAASTQNQNLSAMATQSNAFWGLVQANPGLLVASAPPLAGSYTAVNIGSAPVALQPWLTQLLASTATALPQATVQIATGPDAASGSACTVAGGCSVTLTIRWVQSAKAGSASLGDVTRSQVFHFQFGL